MKLKSTLAFLILTCAGMANNAHAIALQVLILYTDDLFASDEFNSFNDVKVWAEAQAAYANMVYSNSNMNLYIDLNDIEYALVDDNPNDSHVSKPLLNSIMSTANSTVMDLRDVYSPDLTAYVTRYPDTSEDNECGWAYKPNPPYATRRGYYYVDEMAFDAIAVMTPTGCPGSTMVHEFGHLMGADHSLAENDAGHPYPDSRGYAVYGGVNTVMVVDTDFFGGSVTQAVHSNTNTICTYDGNNYQCGASHSKAAKRILQVAEDYTRYYSTCWPSVNNSYCH